jgi:hypothetical protein
MSAPDHKQIADSWLTVQRHWWAYDAVCKLVETSPHEALSLIFLLVSLADTPELLQDIGAGPLEDLLRRHGAAVIDAVESHAPDNPSLRTALSHVWYREGAEVGGRLAALGCQSVPTKSRDDA